MKTVCHLIAKKQPGYGEEPNVRGSADFTQIVDISRFDEIEPFVLKPVANQQMNLFDMEAIPKDNEAELIEYVLLEGSRVAGGKQRIYEFAMTQPTGSAFEKMFIRTNTALAAISSASMESVLKTMTARGSCLTGPMIKGKSTKPKSHGFGQLLAFKGS